MPYTTAESLKELKMAEEFLLRVLRGFEEGDSAFTPAGELFPDDQRPMSVAAQVAHIGITVDWFVDRWETGAWDMEFEKHMARALEATSLAEATDLARRSFARARDMVEKHEERLRTELLPPDDPIMPNTPLWCLVGAISDHTAHHRGSLSVYLRQLGRIPPLPYMDA